MVMIAVSRLLLLLSRTAIFTAGIVVASVPTNSSPLLSQQTPLAHHVGVGINGDLTTTTTTTTDARQNQDQYSNNNINNNNNTSLPLAPPYLPSPVEIPLYLQECGIWLAPSALKGAGLGMYAGKDFGKNDLLQIMGDVVIPIVDRQAHNQLDQFRFLWEEYVWNGWVVGTDMEAYHNADGASPGFGSTANSFLPVVNVKEGTPKRSTGGLHRSKDPGAGAFSSYFDRWSKATRNISAGEEFYVDYGEHWFVDRPQLGPIPLENDLNRATTLFLEHQNLPLPESVRHDMWDQFVHHSPFSESRVFGAFRHDDPDELNELAQLKSLAQLRLNQASKSPEWLYEYGTCGDLIYGNTSTLKQAGRGAFAVTDLPQGAVIAPLPLIHITNRSRLDMYYFKDGIPRINGKITGKRPPQILLNYCYGHAESTLILCPYGPVGNYINHNQTRANVKIIWGNPERGNHMTEWLDEPLESLERDDFAKLAFDVVTTQPIAKGDEIFLDYGDEWETAWQLHWKNWKPVQGANDYLSLEDFGEQNDHDPSKIFRTVFEVMEKPYPYNLKLECNSYFLPQNHGKSSTTTTTDESIILQREMEGYDWFECEILRRVKVTNGYEFAVIPVKKVSQYQEKDETVLEQLPPVALRLREQPYTSDMFLENAFRHDIRIPDEIFPKAWRNAPQKEEVL